ncbi:hypothetical protein XENOCAPTIV_023183, partial [Xenoophorus captivus]
ILRTAVPDMDRETQDQFLVVLQAKDMGGHLGGLSGTTTVTVKLTDVNDNPPRFTQSRCKSCSSGEFALPSHLNSFFDESVNYSCAVWNMINVSERTRVLGINHHSPQDRC